MRARNPSFIWMLVAGLAIGGNLASGGRAVADADQKLTMELVKLVMSPPWSPDKMTDAARDELGFF